LRERQREERCVRFRRRCHSYRLDW
jgi:hypothetical protein